MRKLLAVVLVLFMLLSLAACSGQTGNKPASDQQSSSTGDGSYDISDLNTNEAINALDMLLGEDENMGVKYFKFPRATDYESWPDTSVWQEMGIIDLTPRTCENGQVYNDGQYYTENVGLWNGYIAKCKCGEGDPEEVMQRLWDAGYRGVCMGNGIIVPADDMDELIGDRGYGAFYEYDGWILYAEISVSEWDGSLYCGVYDALTMGDLYEAKLPKISWPTAQMQKMSGDVGGIGSEFYGIWDDDSDEYISNVHHIYAENVTRDQFDSYIARLSGTDGIYCGWSDCDEGYESYDIVYEDDYSRWINVTYCEKVHLVSWCWCE